MARDNFISPVTRSTRVTIVSTPFALGAVRQESIMRFDAGSTACDSPVVEEDENVLEDKRGESAVLNDGRSTPADKRFPSNRD